MKRFCGMFSNRKINTVVFFYMVLFLLDLLSLYLGKDLPIPYKYLFLSPYFFNDATLNWTVSAWCIVLGIHGTIAAISITFMGMFVSQVSASAEFGFDSICRALLFRDNNFLIFSIHSVSSLIFGILLLSIGSGLFWYFASVLSSLYFILNYSSMYYKLYNVTVNPGIIKSLLFDELNSIGLEYEELDERRKEISRSFDLLFSNCNSNVIGKNDYIPYNKNNHQLNIFNNKSNKVICALNLKAITILIKEFESKPDAIVHFECDFLLPLTDSRVVVTPPNDEPLTEDFKTKFEDLIKSIFIYTDLPPAYSSFKELEEAVVLNICNSLLKGNEWSLDFGVKAFNILCPNGNLANMLRKLDLTITSLKKKDIIDVALLARFLEKMMSIHQNKNNDGNVTEILRSVTDLASYIYTPGNYHDFYKRIFHLLKNKVKYISRKDNYEIPDLYFSLVLRNVIAGNYDNFQIDTDLIVKEVRYLDLSGNNDPQILNIAERKFFLFLKEVITLLIIRLDFLISRTDGSVDEINHLKYFLKSWVNAKFLNELFHKREVYELLFLIPNDFSIFNAEGILREVPNGEATWLNITNDTYKAILFILSQNTINKNRFNLIFRAETREFIDGSKILTHQLKSIISILENGTFNSLLNAVSDSGDVSFSCKQLTQQIEKIVSEQNTNILKHVIDADLDSLLTQDYIEGFKTVLLKNIGSVCPLDLVPVSDDNFKITPLNILIDKRELLNTIDGVSYGMNTSSKSRQAMHIWLCRLLKDIGERGKNINILKGTDLLKEEVITIEYMVENKSDVFAYSKGWTISDPKGDCNFVSAGLYYLDLFKNFSLKKKGDLLSVTINKIDEKNIDSVSKYMGFDGMNPFLYALMSVDINILAEGKGYYDLDFLSQEKCFELEEQRNREFEQLIASTHFSS